MEWYETDPSRRSPDQETQAREAYARVLLGSSEGREVMCDMDRRINHKIQDCENRPELAVAQIWLEAFLGNTYLLCGVDNPMLIMELRQQIARSYIEKKEEPHLPEDHLE